LGTEKINENFEKLVAGGEAAISVFKFVASRFICSIKTETY